MCDLLIIDTSNVLYTVAQREKGNVLIASINKITEYVEKFSPRVLVIGNDIGKSRYRKEVYSEYKAGREDKKKQFKKSVQERMAIVHPIRKKLHEIFKGLAVDASIVGVEFDDVASILSHNFKNSVIVTSDKDLTQCPAKIYSPYHNKFISAKEKFGVSQDQVPFALALLGDFADNIKGLNGVGPGTVGYIIEKYGAFETMLEADINTEMNHHAREGLRNLPNFDYEQALDLVTTFTDTSKMNEAEKARYEEIKAACQTFKLEWEFVKSADEREDIFEQFGAFGGQACLDNLAMNLMAR